MNNTIYHIQLRGLIEEEEINAMSPLHMEKEGGDTAVTQFAIHTDQSGLIGLLRYLHTMGFAFVSISCEQRTVGIQKSPG